MTPWGKVADPFADKIDFAIQDIARVRHGEMGGAEASIRIGRDVGSTALRHYESLHASKEGARTAASWAGKGSTIIRAAAHLDLVILLPAQIQLLQPVTSPLQDLLLRL